MSKELVRRNFNYILSHLCQEMLKFISEQSFLLKESQGCHADGSMILVEESHPRPNVHGGLTLLIESLTLHDVIPDAIHVEHLLFMRGGGIATHVGGDLNCLRIHYGDIP